MNPFSATFHQKLFVQKLNYLATMNRYLLSVQCGPKERHSLMGEVRGRQTHKNFFKYDNYCAREYTQYVMVA